MFIVQGCGELSDGADEDFLMDRIKIYRYEFIDSLSLSVE